MTDAHTEVEQQLYLQSDLMQRRALHQLERGGVNLAVVEVDLLIKLHLLPLCNLHNTQRRRKFRDERIANKRRSIREVPL